MKPSFPRAGTSKLSPPFGRTLACLSVGAALAFSGRVLAQTPDDAQAAPVSQPAANATPTNSPAELPASMKADLVEKNKNGRHLAPRDTFYLMKYVSATTDKGVEGFPPGTEVHLVEVHQPTRTLVVTDGHAQVEVSPGDLTNDLDIAALVRQKDQNGQARIAQYMQAEQAAFNKRQEEAAKYTQQDIDRRAQQKQQQVQDALAQEQVHNQEIAASMSGVPNDDYYGVNGYGYGNPYSYFVGGLATGIGRNNAAGQGAPAAGGRGAAPANPANVGAAGAAHPGPAR